MAYCGAFLALNACNSRIQKPTNGLDLFDILAMGCTLYPIPCTSWIRLGWYLQYQQ